MCAAGLLWLLGSVLLVLVLRFAAPPTSAFMLHRQLRQCLVDDIEHFVGVAKRKLLGQKATLQTPSEPAPELH